MARAKRFGRFERIGAVIATFGSVAIASTSAFAQMSTTPQTGDQEVRADVPAKQSAVATRAHEDFQPIGLELGNTTATFGMTNETEYNDNIFLDASRSTDIIDRIKPSFSLGEDFYDTGLNLFGGADIGRYMFLHSENYEDYNINGAANRAIAAESNIRVQAGTARLHTPRGSINDPGRSYGPQQFQRTTITVIPTYSASPFIAAPRLEGRYLQYQNNGPLDGSYSNYYAVIASHRLGYEFDPGWTIFAEPSFEADHYEKRVDLTGIMHDKQVWQGLVGFDYDATADLFFELGAGYYVDKFYKTQIDTSGLALLGSFVWNISALWSLSGDLSRSSSDIQPTNPAFSAGLDVTTTGTLHLDYEAADNWIVSAGTGLTTDETTGASPQTEHSIPFDVGVLWYIDENLRAQAHYIFSLRDSTVASRRTDNNRIIFSLISQI